MYPSFNISNSETFQELTFKVLIKVMDKIVPVPIFVLPASLQHLLMEQVTSL